MLFYFRLSSENISSPYDDRLDKNERLVVTIIVLKWNQTKYCENCYFLKQII